jgi:glycosyltransferase involved in cell wall biosynthesis
MFTSEFPFGSVAETFLETEMEVIAPRFRRIYILPSSASDVVRQVPDNVEVVRMPWLAGYGRVKRRAALLAPATAGVIGSSLRTWRDSWGYLHSPKLYGDILAQNILKAREIAAFVHARGLRSAIFYDYWFENSTLALGLLRRAGLISTAVARAHGFDIFDERWGGLPVPFREAKGRTLDALYSASEAGRAYLHERVPSLRHKLQVCRLGVLDPGVASPEPEPPAPPLIVTCARLIPIKRIHAVPEVLAEHPRPVRWVHIGDGPERARVEASAERLLAPGSWKLLGAIPNAEVRRYYGRTSVQALLSLSASEGLPVSMMEAQSYGIPIVACDVGGVSEIVTPKTGVLVPSDATPRATAGALGQILTDRSTSRQSIRVEFHRRYDAHTNYGAFADQILALHDCPH